MTWEEEVRLSCQRALAMHQFADILGIFTRGPRILQQVRAYYRGTGRRITNPTTRTAWERIGDLKARITRDGFLPNAFALALEQGLASKTFRRDIKFLRRSMPIEFDPVKNIYVLKEAA
jgi:hypothetical protein